MNGIQRRYKALEAIAICIDYHSGNAGIDTGDITVTLSPDFWNMSLSDVMSVGPLSQENVDLFTVKRENAFEIHGIKFIKEIRK